MSYTGAVNGPLVNVVGVHQNDNVPHNLVDGKRELVEVAIQLVDICVVIVSCICELPQAAKLYDHHRDKPVSRNTTIRMIVRAPPDRSLLCTAGNSHCLVTSLPCMRWAAVT